jgi:hypothetical protein
MTVGIREMRPKRRSLEVEEVEERRVEKGA